METDIECASIFLKSLLPMSKKCVEILPKCKFINENNFNKTSDENCVDTGCDFFSVNFSDKIFSMGTDDDGTDDGFYIDFTVLRDLEHVSLSINLNFYYDFVKNKVFVTLRVSVENMDNECSCLEKFNNVIGLSYTLPCSQCNNNHTFADFKSFTEHYDNHGKSGDYSVFIELDVRNIYEDIRNKLNLEKLESIMFPEGTDDFSHTFMSIFKQIKIKSST